MVYVVWLAFVVGLVVGFYTHWLKNHYCQRQLVKMTARLNAMEETLEVFTGKVERMKRAGFNDSQENIDAGILDGINFVLNQKLHKAEH